MEWKRIMNKRLKKADRRKKEFCNEEKLQENKAAKEEIQIFLTQLLPELNFRLLLETESPFSGLLWVESIIVTDYKFIPATKSNKKKEIFRKRLKRWLKAKGNSLKNKKIERR